MYFKRITTYQRPAIAEIRTDFAVFVGCAEANAMAYSIE